MDVLPTTALDSKTKQHNERTDELVVLAVVFFLLRFGWMLLENEEFKARKVEANSFGSQ
jgi:hypothetical protein